MVLWCVNKVNVGQMINVNKIVWIIFLYLYPDYIL